MFFRSEYFTGSDKTKQILIGLGRGKVTSHPVLVHCGKKPRNAMHNCKVRKAPCLYNITADPCEYHNLAAAKPEEVHSLLTRVEEYRQTMVPPRDKPGDIWALPILNGGLWGPWVWGPWVNLDYEQDRSDL